MTAHQPRGAVQQKGLSTWVEVVAEAEGAVMAMGALGVADIWLHAEQLAAVSRLEPEQQAANNTSGDLHACLYERIMSVHHRMHH